MKLSDILTERDLIDLADEVSSGNYESLIEKLGGYEFEPPYMIGVAVEAHKLATCATEDDPPLIWDSVSPESMQKLGEGLADSMHTLPMQPGTTRRLLGKRETDWNLREAVSLAEARVFRSMSGLRAVRVDENGDPLRGPAYEAGEWSLRNWEAIKRDQQSFPGWGLQGEQDAQD